MKFKVYTLSLSAQAIDPDCIANMLRAAADGIQAGRKFYKTEEADGDTIMYEVHETPHRVSGITVSTEEDKEG